MQRIRSLHAQYPHYGYRRMHALLKREGCDLSPGQVLRRMHQGNCLAQRAPRRYVKTTQTQEGQPIFANLAKEMQVTDLNQLWRADLTYVHVQNGMVYLACVLDAYSRKCVGWYLSTSLHTELPLQALEMAIADRQPGPGLVHHSDRGFQYTSHAYRNRLAEIGAQSSMSTKGNPYENAQAESLMKTIKVEEVYLTSYRDFADAQAHLDTFLREVYNAKRLHSSLDYLSPDEFEASLSCTVSLRST